MPTQRSTLELSVDSKKMVTGAKSGKKALDDLGQSARRAENSLESLEQGAFGLQDAFAALGVAVVVDQFYQLLDAATTLDNRLRLVTNTTTELNVIYEELNRISKETRSSVADNSDLFNKLSFATDSLGLSYKQLLTLTDNLNKSLIISGATTQEGAAALRQLGQALGSGTLRGDEFASIAENLPIILNLVADELNRTTDGLDITRGALKNLASEGKLTTDIIVNALLNSTTFLEQEFGKVNTTIAGSLQLIKNNFLDVARDLNHTLDLTTKISNSIIFISNNFNTFLGLLAGVGTLLLGFLARIAKHFVLLAAVSPFAKIALAVVAVTTAFGALSSSVINYGKTNATVGQSSIAGLITIKEVAGEVAEFYKASFADAFDFWAQKIRDSVQTWGNFGLFLQDIVLNTGRIFKQGFNLIAGIVTGTFFSIVAVWQDLPAVFNNLVVTAFNFILTATESGVNGVIDAFKRLLKFVGSAAELVKAENPFAGLELGAKVLDLSGFKGEIITTTRGIGEIVATEFAAALDTDHIENALTSFNILGDYVGQKYIKNLEKTVEATQEVVSTEEILSRAFKEANKVIAEQTSLQNKNNITQKENKNTTEDVEKSYRDLQRTQELFNNVTLQAQRYIDQENEALNKKRNIITSVKGAQLSLIEQQKNINETYNMGVLSLNEYNNAIRQTQMEQLRVSVASGEGGFTEGFLSSLDGILGSTESTTAQIGTLFGDLFANINAGFADSIGRAIVFGDSLSSSLQNVAQQGLAALISGLIKIGLQLVTNSILGNTLATAATAASAAQAAALSAAWGPPAALASLATLGANAGPALAGVAATVGAVKALSLISPPGFAEGTGYVSGPGSGKSDNVLSWLSRGEGVVTAKANARNPGVVDTLNRGGSIGGVQIIVENRGVSVDVQRQKEGRIRIIAQEIATQTVERMTPGVVASDLRNPNSRVSRALVQNTNTTRKR